MVVLPVGAADMAKTRKFQVKMEVRAAQSKRRHRKLSKLVKVSLSPSPKVDAVRLAELER